MRFGGRSNPHRREDREQADAVAAAQQQTIARAAASRRLARMADYFHAQADLLDQMRRQVEDEMAPLSELLLRQHDTMQRTLANLDDRLQPLNEYADTEEANLLALEDRLGAAASEFVHRSFEDYLQQQRERIDETRRRIDDQRRPFLQFSDEQREAVEVSLSRFDAEVAELEANLVEQRKVMMRLLDSMRSDSFASAKDMLLAREAALASAVDEGITDPLQIGKLLRGAVEQAASPADRHIGTVVQALEAADQRLAAAAVSGPRALPARPAAGEPAAEGVRAAEGAGTERTA